jgi:hypothetical protein
VKTKRDGIAVGLRSLAVFKREAAAQARGVG